MQGIVQVLSGIISHINHEYNVKATKNSTVDFCQSLKKPVI